MLGIATITYCFHIFSGLAWQAGETSNGSDS